MNAQLDQLQKLLKVLKEHGLHPAFADAVEDPGPVFGQSVSEQAVEKVNYVSKLLYQIPVSTTLTRKINDI